MRLILFFLLFAGSFSFSKASKIDKAYEALTIFDYFKAKKLFYSCLSKNTCEAAFGLSQIYARKDNPFHQPDSAFRYITISNSFYEKSKAKKYLRFKISDSLIAIMQDSINSLLYRSHVVTNPKVTIQSLEFFLSNYPHSTYYNQVRYKRDSIYYIKMHETKVSDSAWHFIHCFPESAFLKNAWHDLDEFRYLEYTKHNDYELTQYFINQFPENEYRFQAIDLLFHLALKKNNNELMHQTIVKYPSNKLCEILWKKLYSNGVKSYNSSALTEFILDYPDFPYRNTIEEEIAAANNKLLVFENNKKFGAIDTAGKLIIPFEYDLLEGFSEGYAFAEKNERFGYLGKSGKEVIRFQFEDAGPFKEGLAIVSINSKDILIDRAGNILSSEFDQINDFNEGLAVVKQNEKYGVIDLQAKLKVACIFDRIGEYAEGLAAALKNNVYGYIDKIGTVKIPFIFEWAEKFEKKSARVKIKGKYGLINPRGDFIIRPLYDRIEKLNGGYVLLVSGIKYGFADSSGCFISAIDYFFDERMNKNELSDETWLKLVGDEEHNLMDKNGRLFCKWGEYEELYLPKENLFRFFDGTKYGFADGKNKICLKAIYDDAEDFENGFALVRKKNIYSIINHKGESVYSIKEGTIERGEGYYMIHEPLIQTLLSEKVKPLCSFYTHAKIEKMEGNYFVLRTDETSVVIDVESNRVIFGEASSVGLSWL